MALFYFLESYSLGTAFTWRRLILAGTPGAVEPYSRFIDTGFKSGKIIAQVAAASRMAQFTQRLRFDLANTFSRYFKVFPNLFQRVVLSVT